MSEKLVVKLGEAGIVRIVFIRHANAAPPGTKGKGEYGTIHDWQRDDQLRPLTEKGRKQAAVAREWFSKEIGVSSNKVLITSGARRASETLQLMAEQKADKAGFLSSMFGGCSSANTVGMQVAMDLLDGLHPAGISPKCEELFDRNGYAPLEKFHGMEGGEAAFAEYAEIICERLGGVAERMRLAPGTGLALFGHAVFLNAVALALARAWGADAATVATLVSLDLAEAEGILVERGPGGCAVRHLTARPHPLWT